MFKIDNNDELFFIRVFDDGNQKYKDLLLF
jgi:hypothetical protein